jgi:uncharacterized protein
MRLKAIRGLGLVLVLLGVAAIGRGQAVQDLPKPTNYVSDLAGVLSPGDEQALDEYCSEVDHQANAQIAVVTVKTLDGDDPSDYAVKLEEAWKVGPKKSDRGVIVLLATDDHKRWIEVGYGLEGILPDGKVGDIGRGMVPDLRAGNYDGAVNYAVSQIGQTIAADAHVTLQQPMAQQEQPQEEHAGFSLGRLIFYGIVFLIFIVFLSRAGGGGLLGFLLGMFLGGGGRGGFGGGGFGGGSTGGDGAGGSW